jgi:hypothetical protein
MQLMSGLYTCQISKGDHRILLSQSLISIQMSTLFACLISHQPTVLFSHNKPATSNQPAVLFSQNKPALAISHQPSE